MICCQTTRSRVELNYTSRPLPMLGCNRSVHESLKMYSVFSATEAMDLFPRFVWGFDTAYDHSDQDRSAWYYEAVFDSFWYNESRTDWLEGTVRGPFLTIIARDGTPPGIKAPNPPFAVTDSPDCGPLLTSCSQCPVGVDQSRCDGSCRTYGFTYATLTMKFTPGSLVPR